jgi:hypothetical protein
MKQKEDDKTIDIFDVYDQEEAYYAHTINDVVELMIEYGYVKVFTDLFERAREVNK